MWSVVQKIVFGVLIAVCFSSIQAQTSSKNAKPGASVAGRVTIKNKGVAGVVVVLRKSETSGPFDNPNRAITDQDGNYKISSVAAGAYDVVASAPAYVAPIGSDPLSRRVVLSDDDHLENMNFTLVKGGVITGKITDADNAPVIQGPVRIYRQQDVPNRVLNSAQPAPTPFLYPAGTQQTDDRGVYRFFGLTAGKYTVAVGRDNDGFTSPTRAMYSEVFYPDVSDRSKATVIEVSEGSEAKDIDIALGRPMQTFSASGRVIEAEKGEGIPNVRFTLQQVVADRTSFTNAFVSTNARGEFIAENLLPGKYLAFMAAQPNSELRAENTTFEIIDSDVTNITIRMVKGSSISGVVVLDTEDRNAWERLTKLQIMAYSQGPPGSVPSGNSARSIIGPDGSFRLSALAPGTVSIQLAPTMDMSQLKGFNVTSLTRDGAPVGQRTVELKDGEQITNLRIAIAYGSATLRGIVKVENGNLVPGQQIFVRIVRANEEQPMNIRPPSVDQRGHFIADGLASGSYEVWVNINGVRKPTVKQPVVLQNGVATDVVIIYDLADKPNP
jgi:hypothetical protein